MTAVNEAEAFVHDLCRRSFLSVWSLENPLNADGVELADALVVCGDDLVLISVKDRRIPPGGDPEIGRQRWVRDAIVGSVKQLRGAGRMLARMTSVAHRDGLRLTLPPPKRRRVHFIAVALGGEQFVPTGPEVHAFGVVHVLDRAAVALLLGELDTVSDLLHYLRAKERWLRDNEIVVIDGEQDLLARYLLGERTFPREVGHSLVGDGLWRDFARSDAFARRKDAEQASYPWDKLIELFAGHLRNDTLLSDEPPSDTEVSLRYLALENRLQRRLLGAALTGFFDKAARDEAKSRVVASPSGVIYAFVAVARDTPDEDRAAEVEEYAAVLRVEHPDAAAVVVILTERPDGQGHRFALGVHDAPVDDALRAAAAAARRAGVLAGRVGTPVRVQEYPTGSATSRPRKS